MSRPAGAALVIFLLAAAAAIWLLLTPPPSQRVVALGPSEAVLGLTLPEVEAETAPAVEPTAVPPAPEPEAPVLLEDAAPDVAATPTVASILEPDETPDVTPLAPAPSVPAEVVPEQVPPAADPAVAERSEERPAEEMPAVAEPVVAGVPAEEAPEEVPPADPSAEPAVADEAEAAPPDEPTAEEPPEEMPAVAEPLVAGVPAEEAPEEVLPADPSAEPVATDGAEAASPDEPAPEAAPLTIAALAPDEGAAVPPPKPVVPAVPEVPAETEAPPVPADERDTTGVGLTWLAYARPFEGPHDWPRIAIVVAGLGLGRAATTTAIRLPGEITLAFSSHARDLQQWIDLARAAGHEVMLDVPMEPVDYPNVDPGPQALLTTLSSAENVERLKWHLDRASGYVGVTHNMGSRFTASSDDLRPVLSALKVRGLMYLDSRTSSNSVAAKLATTIGLPRAINDQFLDAHASRPAIDRRLSEVERIARENGYSVAISHAFPVTLERLDRWVATLDDKNLALAPISALVNKQAVK